MVRILTNLCMSVCCKECWYVLCENSQCRIRSVCQSCTASVDADTDTADQITHSNGQTSPEQRVPGEDVGCRVDLLDVVELVELG